MSAELKEIINSPALLKLVAQNAFQTIDVNNNGYIGFEEFQDFMRDMSTSIGVNVPSKSEITRAFNSIDVDGDRKIFFDEF